MKIDDLEQQRNLEERRVQCDDWAAFLADRLMAYRVHGIPESVAMVMLRDLNYLAAARGFYPDQPPPACAFGPEVK